MGRSGERGTRLALRPVMSRILILHASSHGSTRAIAAAIATRLSELGHQAELRDLMARNAPPPSGYDAVIIGARVHGGSHPRPVMAYVRQHRDALAGMPSAFFSVSLSAASTNPKGRAAADQTLERFCQEAGWRPRHRASVAGTLAYTRYNLLTRFVMKRISARSGGSTDTSHDHEYTDWSQVALFAGAIAAELETHDTRIA
jgi:menaquinone-dependent protoporphyrinogen oxidase